MPVITLTSDFGLNDYYLAAVKGSILREIPQATLVDIAHDLPHHDLTKAGYILRNCFRHFPEGSIHIIGIDSIESESKIHVAMKAEGHYFIGADTGVFSLILKSHADEIVQLNLDKQWAGTTFPMLRVFAPAACHLARGGTLQVIGRLIGGYKKLMLPAPPRGESYLGGVIQHVDAYGNLITNIDRETFESFGRNTRFSILLRKNQYGVSRISKNYHDAAEGELAAFFNHEGNLEIALNRGSASRLLGLKLFDNLRIEFYAD
jgi:S-adenosylmethionine hydrolase